MPPGDDPGLRRARVECDAGGMTRIPLAILSLILLAAAGPAAETRTFLVTPFERIRVEGPFDVTVTTGMTAKAHATGDRGALEMLSVTASGSTLTVRAGADDAWNERGLSPGAIPTIVVEVPRLTGASVNGGGRLRIAEMRAQRVEVNVAGAGTIDVAAVRAETVNATLIGSGTIALAGTASRVQLRSNGAGSIDAAGLRAGEVSLVAETSGDTSASARYSAQVSALGLGAVRVDGGGKCTVRGNGPVACEGGIDRRR